MLIVGREIGQSVIIGEEIKVTVLQTGSKPRIAIEAPKHIKISKLKQHPKEKDVMKKQVRKIVDTILIGDAIKLTILQTVSGLLRFAIEAPREISIFREELFQKNFISETEKILII
ncbi:carbon storage regulator [Bacillus sp. DNRA2]|uniref:carbon storage regulator n=1 Tax=Bacillus sp. DNRA2 TaxID=2723053 RepID=UPI00145DE4BF|nr:carbon storage regulator [Bacillus sp. DNRA2]NMD69129.1 carbon storage regulator [Bacillus sp. DNRA2]